MVQSYKGTHTVTLNNVLYLPSSPYNLISFGHVQSKGFRLKFNAQSTSNFDIVGNNGTLLAHCQNIENVYAIANVVPIPPTEPILQTEIAKSKVTTHSLDEWHHILGHTHPDTIVQMVSKDMVKGMNIKRTPGDTRQNCDICIQAKQHVQSYPKESECKYKDVGDMTYTDIWGPSRTTG
jgi:hypothetical protein